jgi:hypothetical protein
MKLTEFDNKKIATASRALKEHYEMPFNVAKMPMDATKSMLRKVRGLMSESKQSPNFYKEQASPSYMKLVFMEQALSAHFADLSSRPKARIVVENEEIEKSQVYLAAQDLSDSVQKMLEEVGQMQVKELPALVTSIESEIGVSESQAFNDQVTQQLSTLSSTLSEVQAGLKSAVNSLTGQGDMGAEAFGTDDLGAEGDIDAGMDDLDAGIDDIDTGMDDMGADLGATEEPEFEPVGGVGRAKR